MKEIKQVLASFTKKKILVIGDIMLDHYIWGKVERISPEAPVPVLDVHREEYRLGGAANVALNLKALGADVTLIGLVGNDSNGIKLMRLLKKNKIENKYIVIDKSRKTTTKTRIGADTQQIVRIDAESREDICKTLETKLLKNVEMLLSFTDYIIIEDYNKGLLTASLIHGLLSLSAQYHKAVAVDPKHKNFFEFTGVEVFKPNYSELQKNLGKTFESEKEFIKAGWNLKKTLKCKHLVVTRGEKGMYIFSEDKQLHHIKSVAREVFDVSGAGDTVISALSLSLAEGCDILTAAEIANHAAGIVCGKMGTATVSQEEIIQSYEEERMKSDKHTIRLHLDLHNPPKKTNAKR